MRIVRLVLSAALGASALVGIQILATDYWLWSASPTHAYGLIAFVGLDLALVFGVWRVPRLATFGTLLTATFQLVAMLGDIVGGQPAGLQAAVFRNYLLADTAYIGLLVTQGLILAIAIGTWALPHLRGHWPGSLRIVRN
jgi:hypothetical protein